MCEPRQRVGVDTHGRIAHAALAAATSSMDSAARSINAIVGGDDIAGDASGLPLPYPTVYRSIAYRTRDEHVSHTSRSDVAANTSLLGKNFVF
eukprot:6184412-Pleurochrysis_carterae.AAC.2